MSLIYEEVPSLELCQQWESMGGSQDTVLSWVRLVGKEKYELMLNDDNGDFIGAVPDDFDKWYERSGCEFSSAPLIGEMKRWCQDIKFYIHSPDPLWTIELYKENKFICDESLPDAFMQMCIWIKEKK